MKNYEEHKLTKPGWQVHCNTCIALWFLLMVNAWGQQVLTMTVLSLERSSATQCPECDNTMPWVWQYWNDCIFETIELCFVKNKILRNWVILIHKDQRKRGIFDTLVYSNKHSMLLHTASGRAHTTKGTRCTVYNAFTWSVAMQELVYNQDPNTHFNAFLNKFLTCINKHSPMKKKV